jgi:hypothetical protein
MKNAILSLLIFTSLIFSSCKKDEVASPDYTGTYTSTPDVFKGSSGNTISIQYKAVVTHNVSGKTTSINLKETRSILNYPSPSGVYTDDFFYNIYTIQVQNSQSSIVQTISQFNSKSEKVGNVDFNGTLTYSATNLVYRGTIGGIPTAITLSK